MHGCKKVAVVLPLLLGLWPFKVQAQTNCLSNYSTGQQQAIGCFESLSERKWLFFRRNVEETDKADLWRGAGRIPLPVRLRDAVHPLDSLYLHGNVYIDLLLRQQERPIRAVVSTLDKKGVWSIREDTLPSLVITHGQMLIQNRETQARIEMENMLAVGQKSTVFYEVDEAAATGYVFLREGHISFPEHGIDVQGQDSLWVVRPGQRPMPVFLTAAARQRWREKVEYSSQTVWLRGARPLVQRPKFWLLVGGVGLAAATVIDCTLVHALCFDDQKPRRGLIDVIIPIPN